MRMEATAITSAEPVDMTAIKIKKSMAYSPVVPSSFCATRGAARPAETSSSVSRGAPWAEDRPR